MRVFFNLVHGFAFGFIAYKPSYEFDDVEPDDEYTEVDIIFGCFSIKFIY